MAQSRNKKHDKHSNSGKVRGLEEQVRALEEQLRRRGVCPQYPTQQHEHTPMLGHTRGNTANNRRVIKRHQEKELKNVVQHLRALLTSSVTDEDEEEAGDAGKRGRRRGAERSKKKAAARDRVEMKPVLDQGVQEERQSHSEKADGNGSGSDSEVDDWRTRWALDDND